MFTSILAKDYTEQSLELKCTLSPWDATKTKKSWTFTVQESNLQSYTVKCARDIQRLAAV